jgi:hypothetical protein
MFSTQVLVTSAAFLGVLSLLMVVFAHDMREVCEGRTQ